MTFFFVRSVSLAVLALTVQAGAATADTLSGKLTSFEEVPSIFSNAKGTFTGTTTANSISYSLNYQGVTDVTQAHIHFAQAGVNGGIMVFLCSNLGNGPVGTQACPAAPATVSGTITSAKVVGPTSQNISAGQMPRVIAAIKKGHAYVNVHSTAFPSGEIRAQIVSTP